MQVHMKIKLNIFEIHFVALATSTVLVKLQKLTSVNSMMEFASTIHQTVLRKLNFHFLTQQRFVQLTSNESQRRKF